ncbi:hypothetical protein BE21_11345 [Sorangium cellulosum]|uniref:Uncharacterized protein n=2 Tax=Sorangium cellulosum TaxID=56 RepID=A0A150U121_SORCE|nr:hypothetical protein SCE1572_39455 [Sorangium cellulosum So0157-2]KYG10574.1 hypothetical protein BE21_11345 [Sorangium cellulosum]
MRRPGLTAARSGLGVLPRVAKLWDPSTLTRVNLPRPRRYQLMLVERDTGIVLNQAGHKHLNGQPAYRPAFDSLADALALKDDLLALFHGLRSYSLIPRQIRRLERAHSIRAHEPRLSSEG